MATKLTDIAVEAWKPDPSKRLEIGDALVPGLFLVIQPSGKKSWAVRYRHQGQPRKLTLGPLAMIRLAAARDAARDKLQAVARGEDPAADKQAAKAIPAAAPVAAPSDDVAWWTLVEDFNRIELAGLRSGPQVFRALERETKDRWQGRAAASITKRDVQALVDAIKSGEGRQRGPAPVQANRVLSYVSWAFSWGMRRDYVATNPCANVDKAANEYERRRDRVLDDAEIADVWRAADALGHPFGPMVHMLILTGTRLREVAEAEWAEFDLERRLWTIPAGRAKNGEAHRVHLTETALAILKGLPRIGEHPRFVFTTTGTTPISGFDRAKRRIDAELAKVDAARQERGDVFAPRQPWVFHDLRRSVASGLARLKVPFEVVERILAHRGESASGLRAVYNRHSYAEEKREALTVWADHVAGVVRNESVNVVALSRRARKNG